MLTRLVAALWRLFRLFGLGRTEAPAAPPDAPPPVRPRLAESEISQPGPPPPPPPSPEPPQPMLALAQLIDVAGAFPPRAGTSGPAGFTLGMIHSFAGPGTAFGAPRADGRDLPVNRNQPVMAVLGLSYGGNGINVGLPNLRGRTPVGGGATGTFGNHTLVMTYLIATGEASGAPALGMVAAFGGNYAPPGWAVADGTMLPISANVPLYEVIGQTFGGNPVAFALPALDRLAVIGVGEAPGLPPVALGAQIEQPVPSLGLNYLINANGAAAPAGGNGAFPQFAASLGEVIAFAGGQPPSGWLACDGTLLDTGQYSALFELIGTTYGGDGQSSFALPDLRGRILIGG